MSESDQRGGSSPRVNAPLPFKVTVFGAGVAGMTAAQELAERGFRVKVVDPTPSLDVEGQCEVGGLAQSQWSHAAPRLRHAPWAGMRRAPACIGVPQKIHFEPTVDADPPQATGKKLSKPSTEYDPKLALSKWDQLHSPQMEIPKRDTVDNATKVREVASTLLTGVISYLGIRPDSLPKRCEACKGCEECAPYASCDRCGLCYAEPGCKGWNLELDVVGHCDSDPGPAVARAAGYARAEQVIDALKTELDNAAADPNERRLPAGAELSELIDLRPSSEGCSELVQDEASVLGRLRNNRVAFRVGEVRLPGEHGYRFFPRFYHHLDDVMKRIPIYEGGRETFRTVFDNLHELSQTAFAPADGKAPIAITRHRPSSMEALLRSTEQMQSAMDVPPLDVLQLQLKFFKYMTSSSDRRARECEAVSWWEYVNGEQYSEKMQHLLKVTPQALVAMSVTGSDARTNGNMSVQFLMDQLSDGTNVDRTLNGPTSEAWLRPWKHYLKRQGVQFFQGQLDELSWEKRESDEAFGLLPHVSAAAGQGAFLGLLRPKPKDDPDPPHDDDGPREPTARPPLLSAELSPDWDGGKEDFSQEDFYVLALPPEGAKKVLANLGDEHLGDTLRTLKAYDFDEAMAEMVGIQFYFQNRFNFFDGHTFFADSAWRLTTISQLQFWHTPRNLDSGYLSVLSVDIGDMDRQDTSAARHAASEARLEATHAEAQRTPGFELAMDAARKAIALSEQAPIRLSASEKKNLWEIFGLVMPRSLPEPRGPSQSELEQVSRLTPMLPAAVAGVIDAGVSAMLHEEGASEKGESLVVRAGWYAIIAATSIDDGMTARQSTPDEIAEATWRQIKLGLDAEVARKLPNPIYYSIDHTLDFDPKTQLPAANHSRLLINRMKFSERPGPLPSAPGHPDSTYYEVHERWVLAGMVTKTRTRLTCMEESCESAKHATNAILNDIQQASPVGPLAAQGAGQRYGDFCEIFDPEEREFPDLAFLKEIDARLSKEGLPHFLDILGVEEALARTRTLGGTNPLQQLQALIDAWRGLATQTWKRTGGESMARSALDPLRSSLSNLYGPALAETMIRPWEELMRAGMNGPAPLDPVHVIRRVLGREQVDGVTDSLSELFRGWQELVERLLVQR